MQRTFIDGVLAGVIGVASGFAVFILIWEKNETTWELIIILLAVAILASAFEHLRDVIDGHSHPFSLSQMVSRFVLVAFFELFVTAAHATFALPRITQLEIGTAVLGPVLADEVGPVLNLITMALLWVLIGGTLGGCLALTVYAFDPNHSLAKTPARFKGLVFIAGQRAAGPIAGLITAAVVAPLVVFIYLLAARLFIEFKWMVISPQQWVANVDNLYARIPATVPTFPLKLVIGLASKLGHWFPGKWGPVLIVSAFIALVVILFKSSEKKDRGLFFYSAPLGLALIVGLPLLGTSLYGDFKNILQLLVYVAVVWIIPGLLLGIALHYLRRPSEHPKLWAFVAWFAACILMVFTFLLHANWILLLIALMVLMGLHFWQGAEIEKYWHVIALSLATIVLGGTKIEREVNFLHIQDLSLTLLNQPLYMIAPHRTGNATLGEIQWDSYLQSSHELIVAISPQVWREDLEKETREIEELTKVTSELTEETSEQVRENLHLLEHSPDLSWKHLPELSIAQSKTDRILVNINKQKEAASAKTQKLSKLIQQRPHPLGLLQVDMFQSLDRLQDPSAVEERRQVTTSEAAQAELIKQNEALAQQDEKLKSSSAPLNNTINELRANMSQQFELCLAGSLGFWIPLGMLAAWNRQRGAKVSHESE